MLVYGKEELACCSDALNCSEHSKSEFVELGRKNGRC